MRNFSFAELKIDGRRESQRLRERLRVGDGTSGMGEQSSGTNVLCREAGKGMVTLAQELKQKPSFLFCILLTYL